MIAQLLMAADLLAPASVAAQESTFRAISFNIRYDHRGTVRTPGRSA